MSSITNLIIFRRIFIISCLVASCYSVYAQGIITGSTTPVAGVATSYTLTDDVLFISPEWSADNGTVMSSSVSGITYTASIKFLVPGPSTVYFKSGTAIIYTLAVNVNCPLFKPMNTTFSYTNNCGNTVITRNTSPPTSAIWYWQTSATGTDTSQPNATYTVTSSNIYYLRPQSSTVSGCWGDAIPTSAVSIIAIPGAPSGNVSPSSLCQPGSVTWGATGAIANEVYRWYTDATLGSPITPAASVSVTTTYYVSKFNTVALC